MRAIVLILAILACTSGIADVRLGVQAEGFATQGTFAKGGMVGMHFYKYLPDSGTYVGLAMKAGSVNGGNLSNDNLTVGSAVVGHDSTAGDIFHVEEQVEVGYGEGTYGKGAIVEPSFGVGLVVVYGYRAIFSVGYMYAPAPIQPISGFTFSIKLDRKLDVNGNGADQ